MKTDIVWEGPPILYSRKCGHGLIIGGAHYLFDEQGQLERMLMLNQVVLTKIVKEVYGDKGKDMAVVYITSAAQRAGRTKRRLQQEAQN